MSENEIQYKVLMWSIEDTRNNVKTIVETKPRN